jgi:hypothetical protein
VCQVLATVAEHRMAKDLEAASVVIRDQQALAHAALSALSRASDEAQLATEVSLVLA